MNENKQMFCYLWLRAVQRVLQFEMKNHICREFFLLSFQMVLNLKIGQGRIEKWHHKVTKIVAKVHLHLVPLLTVNSTPVPNLAKRWLLHMARLDEIALVVYSGDLKSHLIWIANGSKEVGLQIVWILNGI